MKKLTSTDLFNATLSLAKAAGALVDAEQILEYAHASELPVELKDHQFTFIAEVSQGNNEGIFVSCFAHGKFGGSVTRRIYLGYAKTLSTSLDSYRAMGSLAGTLAYYAGQHINECLGWQLPQK